MQKKPTTKNIIKDWLNACIICGEYVVKSHQLETALVRYGKDFWGATKLPSAYSRAWRQIRADKDFDGTDIIKVQELKSKTEGQWKLITTVT